MIRRQSFILASFVALVTASEAQAGSSILATGPAYQNYPTGQRMYCNIVNVGKEDTNVGIDMMSYEGTVELSSAQIVGPGRVASLSSDTTFASWCRFRLDTKPKNFRAAAVYLLPGGTYSSAVEAR